MKRARCASRHQVLNGLFLFFFKMLILLIRKNNPPKKAKSQVPLSPQEKAKNCSPGFKRAIMHKDTNNQHSYMIWS